MNIAASFHSAFFWNGSTAPIRFPRCIDAPVGLTPVMIFLDIHYNFYEVNIRKIEEKAIGLQMSDNNQVMLYFLY